MNRTSRRAILSGTAAVGIAAATSASAEARSAEPTTTFHDLLVAKIGTTQTFWTTSGRTISGLITQVGPDYVTIDPQTSPTRKFHISSIEEISGS